MKYSNDHHSWDGFIRSLMDDSTIYKNKIEYFEEGMDINTIPYTAIRELQRRLIEEYKDIQLGIAISDVLIINSMYCPSIIKREVEIFKKYMFGAPGKIPKDLTAINNFIERYQFFAI
jgi:hypothetical protein